MSEERRVPDDPREAGGSSFDAGTPHERGKVMYDARRAVLVDYIETSVAQGTSGGEPMPDSVALVIQGRINRPPDDDISRRAPLERVEHLHLMSWDASADLICDLFSLAARDGKFDLGGAVRKKWVEAERKGLTRRVP